jgi:succinate dehydrogenase / fumarate reductase cytochrome b subunit
MGFFLVIFIVEHLFTNSLAAAFWNEQGAGFVKAVNLLQDIPYLKVIEVLLLAIPIVYHGFWGMFLAKKAAFNVLKKEYKKPFLGYFERNWAYTLQRITSWFLIFFILFHVVQMRFMNHPEVTFIKGKEQYIVKLSNDEGLEKMANRWKVSLVTFNDRDSTEGLSFKKIDKEKKATAVSFFDKSITSDKLKSLEIHNNEVLAFCPSFSIALLLIVRDTFKSPLMIGFYSLFVLMAVFHAFNGLWTFLISFGILLNDKSQKWMLKVCYFFMLVAAFWGFAAIFGSPYLGY